MAILTLLSEARAAGLSLSALDGRLIVRGPKSAAPLVAALASRKEEVLLALTPPTGAVEPEASATTGPPCPPPYPWRAGLSGWRVDWSEAWGRRTGHWEGVLDLLWWQAEQRARSELDRLRELETLPPDATVEAILAALDSESAVDVSP